MKITLNPTSLLLLKKDEKPFAVIADPTLELITKAVIKEDDLTDAILTNPRDFNGSNEPEETLTYHCFTEEDDYYQDIVISEISVYGEFNTNYKMHNIIESLSNAEFTDPITDEHIDFLMNMLDE